jgi:hypothetical protein
MYSTASMVRAKVEYFGPDIVFTTRDILECGKRTAVDHALSRLVKSGVIRRLAAGVFIAVVATAPDPSAEEIAGAKAAAFRKHIYVKETVLVDSQPVYRFRTDGCRSSFKSIHGRLFFVPVSTKSLPETSQSITKHSAITKPRSTPAPGLQLSPSLHLTCSNSNSLAVPVCLNQIIFLPDNSRHKRDKLVTVAISSNLPTRQPAFSFASAGRFLHTLVSKTLSRWRN